MKIHVRLTLSYAYCYDTEDVGSIPDTGGIDELYCMGAFTDGKQAHAALLPPQEVNKNLIVTWPSDVAVLFEGDIEETATLRGSFIAWDEDYAKDWAQRSVWIDRIVEALMGFLW